MPQFDVTVPNIARVYDYWLGGKDNFAVDRQLGDKLLDLYPPTAEIVRENKQFLARAIAWVAGEGIRQFIDLGAGLPTSPSTQETAQAVTPDARVAYVDNDPVVVVHLRAVLASGEQHVTVVDHDVRDVDAVLDEVSIGIDLQAPTCLILGSLLHFFPVHLGQDMVNRYVKALGSGSYVILSVGRSSGEQSERFMSIYRTDGAPPMYHYTTADITDLFASLEMVPPGLTTARAWHPDGADLPAPPQRQGDMLAGVARLR